MSLRDVYCAFGEDSESGKVAGRLLEQQHWFTTLADFDPKTGEALPLGLDEVLRRLSDRPELTTIHDRLFRIVDHSRLAVTHLLGSLSESPRREQAMLLVRSIRELNATSFIALNRRPGRNVREKLAGKPYMQAVRRYQSIDVPENRLLKAFVARLADLLELRQRYLHEEDALLTVLHSWLRSDEANDIGRWDNLPPNNTLLSHREYRRVWDAWRWLQTLDDDIDRDLARIDERAAVVAAWEDHARAFQSETVIYGGMPVIFDFEDFAIRPWMERLPSKSVAPFQRPKAIRSTSPVCIDFTEPRPGCATVGTSTATLTDLYYWQRWRREDAVVDLDLYEADFLMLHPESIGIAMPDLLFGRELDPALAHAARHSFARRLRQTFSSSSLTWLLPDHLNEFQVEVLRRNLNARFPQAEPLPRSVAAVFAQVGHREIKRDGYTVVVLDKVGGVTTATRLVARVDSDLARRAPETKGYYWERTPALVLDRSPDPHDPLLTVSHVAADGQWRERSARPSTPGYTEKDLHARKDLGQFDKLVIIAAPPVDGGVRLHQLQSAAGDIALWRDQVPELSIKVIKDNRYQPFYLVGKDTTIRPVRGEAIPIPVRDEFTLPAGKTHFQFPLFQGSDATDLGYEARIDSPAFPLARDTRCRLRMTYTYGADEPYRLVFEALDKSFSPLHVKWRPKRDEPVTDAPGPEYPATLTWQELQSHYFAEKNRTNDYLDWAISQTERFLERIESPTREHKPAQIETATVKVDWKIDRKGGRFTFAQPARGDDVFIHEKSLREGLSWSSIRPGSTIYFERRTGRDGKVFANDVTFSADRAESTPAIDPQKASSSLVSLVRSAIYVPYIKTWSDGRSVSDTECPAPFRARVGQLTPRLEAAMRSAKVAPEVHQEIRFLFCCMHRDMPTSVSNELVTGLSSKAIDERGYGFALGDVSQPWQYEIARRLLGESTYRALSVFAQAIWRSSRVVTTLHHDDLVSLATRVEAELSACGRIAHPTKDEVARITRLTELLLGLLRSRDSTDSETRGAMQPTQEITRALAMAVDAAAACIERSGIELRSRVQLIGLPDKPEGDRTPDLLYALRLYLTGDIGANAIRVTGVLDGDDD